MNFFGNHISIKFSSLLLQIHIVKQLFLNSLKISFCLCAIYLILTSLQPNLFSAKSTNVACTGTKNACIKVDYTRYICAKEIFIKNAYIKNIHI